MLKKPLQNCLGNALKDYRKQEGFSQATVAEWAKISLPTLRNLECGQGNLSTWWAVLDVLGVEVQGHNLPGGKRIGERLALLRKRRGISQRTLCELIGCSQPTLVKLERHSIGRLSPLNRSLVVLGAGAYLARLGESPSFYTHAGNSSVYHNWQTPPELLEQLYQVFQFDLDPCSLGKDHKTAPVRASMYYTEQDDGLSLPWYGTVFVNPPYGRGLAKWIEKCRYEVEQGNAKTVVALIPARSDTRYWHEHIARKATVFFLMGRLCFGGDGQPAPFPSALILWGCSPEQHQLLSNHLSHHWVVNT